MKQIARRALMLLLLVSVVVWPTRRAHAGAWTEDPGHFYLQMGTTYTFADDRFGYDKVTSQYSAHKTPFFVSANGELEPSTKPSNFQQLLSDLYFEVGAYKRVTLFGDFAFLESERQRNDTLNGPPNSILYHSTGVGDLMLGSRFGILQKPLALAAEVRVTFPTGLVNNGKYVNNIPLGPGDTRVEFRGVASKAFNRVPIYVDGEFGVTVRGTVEQTNLINPNGLPIKYDNEFVIHLEVGGTLVRWKYDRVLLIVTAEHRQSFHLPDRPPAATTINPSESALTTVGGNLLVYIIPQFGINLRYNQAVAGALLPATTSLGAGVFGRW